MASVLYEQIMAAHAAVSGDYNEKRGKQMLNIDDVISILKDATEYEKKQAFHRSCLNELMENGAEPFEFDYHTTYIMMYDAWCQALLSRLRSHGCRYIAQPRLALDNELSYVYIEYKLAI